MPRTLWSGGTAGHIINLGTRLKRVAGFMLWSLHFPWEWVHRASLDALGNLKILYPAGIDLWSPPPFFVRKSVGLSVSWVSISILCFNNICSIRYHKNRVQYYQRPCKNGKGVDRPHCSFPCCRSCHRITTHPFRKDCTEVHCWSCKE